MKRTPLLFALLAATVLDGSRDVQLLPAGEFKARDGRPGPGKTWKLSDAQGAALAQKLTRISAQSKFVFDYDHQSLLVASNGQPAPASGWAAAFEWRPGKGLYALNVEWTKRAAEMIDAKEYLYVSPVIQYDKDGNVIGVLNAALTNTPALLGMDAVVADFQARLSVAPLSPHRTSTESNMDLLQLLIAALNLKADTNETEALSAVAALKARADAQPVIPQPIAAALSIKADGDVATAVEAIKALQTQVSGTEQTTLNTIAALQAQVAELSAAQHAGAVNATVEKAIADGKLVPAMREWAIDLGKKDQAALNAFIDKAPVLNFGQAQSGGKGPEGGGQAALTADEKGVIARMGITEEQYRQAQAAA